VAEEDGEAGTIHWGDGKTDDPLYGKLGKGAKKKGGGLFRGLGSMFRFGRHRKSTGGTSDLKRHQIGEDYKSTLSPNSAQEREKARESAYQEQIRIQV